MMFHPWQFVLQIGLTSPDGFRLGDGSCRAQILHAFRLLAQFNQGLAAIGFSRGQIASPTILNSPEAQPRVRRDFNLRRSAPRSDGCRPDNHMGLSLWAFNSRRSTSARSEKSPGSPNRSTQ